LLELAKEILHEVARLVGFSVHPIPLWKSYN
jgi:hypothetical protein